MYDYDTLCSLYMSLYGLVWFSNVGWIMTPTDTTVNKVPSELSVVSNVDGEKRLFHFW